MHSQAIDIMRYVRKRAVVFILAASLVAVLISLFGMSPFANQVANAWCEGSSFNRDDYMANDCIVENLSEIEKLPQGRALTATEYVSRIQACEDGNAGGLDKGALAQEVYHDTGCANAIVTCHRNAIDVADCTPDNLKTIGGSECNFGKLTNNGNDDCQRLKEMNGAHIDKIAASACVGESDNAEGIKATNDCKSAVNNACLRGDILNDDGTVRGDRFKEAQKCANEESLRRATSPESCAARGGVYVDRPTQGPNGTNKIDKGCYNQASDLKNQEACEAAAATSGRPLVWQRTDKPPEKEAWGCVDQDNPNGENGKDEDAKAAAPTIYNEIAVEGRCGDAKVNILACGEDNKGASALNSILRIGLLVLSVLVGIAAVGGLTWASILYAKAADNQGSVSEAKELIRNIIIGLVLYVFLVAIVQFLVPGGVISDAGNTGSTTQQP